MSSAITVDKNFYDFILHYSFLYAIILLFTLVSYKNRVLILKYRLREMNKYWFDLLV